MIFYILIAIALLLVIRTVTLQFRNEGLVDGFWSILWSPLLATLCLFVITFMTTVVMGVYEDWIPEGPKDHYPIASLRASNEIHGSFFLGCGGIGATEKYYFMYDLGNGHYRRDNVYTDQAVIHETDSEKPNLSYQRYMVYNSRIGKWWPSYLLFKHRKNSNYVLTVPKGTVIQRFEVN